MTRNHARILAAGLAASALWLGGCAGGDELPDIATGQYGGNGEKTVEAC
jgi:hypothetical protein